jgi:hypothetical protein
MLPAAPEVEEPVRTTKAPLLSLVLVPVLRTIAPLTPVDPEFAVDKVMAPLDV